MSGIVIYALTIPAILVYGALLMFQAGRIDKLTRRVKVLEAEAAKAKAA